MAELVEDGKKPEGKLSSYVKCPHCNTFGDYWKTSSEARSFVTSAVNCLNCLEKFYIHATEWGVNPDGTKTER